MLSIDSPFLFLGNYVNHGRQGTDVLITLLALKCRSPERYHLLRGRHDGRSISRIMGFYDECQRLYNVQVWRAFMEVCSYMPLCALAPLPSFTCEKV